MFCQECNQSQTICQDTTPTPCECAVKDLSTDCIVYTGDESTCSNIPKGVTLTEYLQQLDTFICQALDEINSGANLINVGTGVGIYKGIDILGRREIKSLKSTDNSVTITSTNNNTEIDLSVNVVVPELCLTSTDSSVTIEEEEGCFNLSAKTFVEAGENMEISGEGTEADPYLFKSIFEQTELQDGITTNLVGNGTTIPYSVEVLNLQKTISLNDEQTYTLLPTDDKHTIFVTVTGTTSLAYINIPSTGMPNNFSCAFILEGTGNNRLQVFAPSVTVKVVNGHLPQILGDANWMMVERKTNTNNYFVLGNLEES